MTPKQIIQVAAILGALAVGIGAFGAHGLEDLLAKNGRTETFETAVKYHFYHAIALLLVGILSNSRVGYLRGMSFSAINLIIGIIIFSGSLYILSITNITWLGAITPIGGIAFILGWVGIFWTVTKR